MQSGVVWADVISDKEPPHTGHYWYQSWDSNDNPLQRCHYCPAIWWPGQIMPAVLCPGSWKNYES